MSFHKGIQNQQSFTIDFLKSALIKYRQVYNIKCMTQFIDISYDKNIDRSSKPNPINHIDRFLYSTSIALRRKLTQIAHNSFCVSLKSSNFNEKIKYFTVLDVFESHIDIKIIPCDSAGSYLRSKENFNKNGWIRKHINENKNKFLKVNPLTGEVFFIYSCFIPQTLRITKFWNELFQKIKLVEKQLPQLLSKIINLEGKQKPMSFIQQVIETNKLVCTIKLAQMFHQNIKIENQFENFDPDNIETSYKNQGYIAKTQIQQFKIYSKPLEEVTPLRNILNTIQKDFLFYRKVLQAGSFTIGKSNITNMTLTKQDEDKIGSKLKKISIRQEFRHKIQQFNRQLFIMVKKQQREKVKKIKRILNQIGEQVQYKFLDNYLSQNSFEDTIMTVAAKELQLTQYCWRNFLTISYETKFRIFIQTVNSIVTLWMKNNISFQNISINHFTIVKNMTVKLKRLQHAKYIHPSRLQSDQVILIYNQKKQILKEFSNIYFEIFFHKKSVNFRYKNNKIKKQPQYKMQDLIFQSLNELTKAYYPNDLFTLIIGLNYFFIQQYFRNIENNNYISDFDNFMDAENNRIEGKQRHFGKVLHHKRRLQQARKGGPRVDVILAMCIQFLEQHQIQSPDKGGEI